VSILALALVVLLGSAAEPTPLGNEEIVRMVAAGTPEKEILEAIAARPPAYDLDEDMLEELRTAGVSAAVIAAMKARAARSMPEAPPPERPRRGTVPLVVTLNGGKPQRLQVPAWADEDAKELLQLPKEEAEREVKDLAVFLACTTAQHVPDLWREKTPLGRDPHAAFRHEMLVFVAGDTPAGKKPHVRVPERLETHADDLEAHALVLGVAARIGDRWRLLSASKPEKATLAPGGAPLSGKIVGAKGQPFAFTVELTVPKAAAR
jgi:hypothetical protein